MLFTCCMCTYEVEWGAEGGAGWTGVLCAGQWSHLAAAAAVSVPLTHGCVKNNNHHVFGSKLVSASWMSSNVWSWMFPDWLKSDMENVAKESLWFPHWCCSAVARCQRIFLHFVQTINRVYLFSCMEKCCGHNRLKERSVKKKTLFEAKIAVRDVVETLMWFLHWDSAWCYIVKAQSSLCSLWGCWWALQWAQRSMCGRWNSATKCVWCIHMYLICQWIQV